LEEDLCSVEIFSLIDAEQLELYHSLVDTAARSGCRAVLADVVWFHGAARGTPISIIEVAIVAGKRLKFSISALIHTDSLLQFEVVLADAGGIPQNKQLYKAAHQTKLSAAVPNCCCASRHRRAYFPC
jgi:hypothetical protein